MDVDPRSLVYPAHDTAESSTGAEEAGLDSDTSASADRRTGTNSELKELDRIERRDQEKK